MDRCRKANALRTFGADFSSYYTKEDVDALLAAPSSAAYPVGSIYQSTDPTSPAALFGGTMGADRIRPRADGCQQKPRGQAQQ